MTKDTWPKHADGRPKKMGEMTPDERRACTKASVARLKAEFENPTHQDAMEKVLSKTVERVMK